MERDVPARDVPARGVSARDVPTAAGPLIPADVRAGKELCALMRSLIYRFAAVAVHLSLLQHSADASLSGVAVW
jgi:hypothetical protein